MKESYNIIISGSYNINKENDIGLHDIELHDIGHHYGEPLER
jgi:hypothetical protein